MDKQNKSVDIEQNKQQLRQQKKVLESPKEIGGPKGPEPTRYGDWEKNGRCIDF